MGRKTQQRNNFKGDFCWFESVLFCKVERQKKREADLCVCVSVVQNQQSVCVCVEVRSHRWLCASQKARGDAEASSCLSLSLPKNQFQLQQSFCLLFVSFVIPPLTPAPSHPHCALHPFIASIWRIRTVQTLNWHYITLHENRTLVRVVAIHLKSCSVAWSLYSWFLKKALIVSAI